MTLTPTLEGMEKLIKLTEVSKVNPCILLVCHASAALGIGHLTRMLALGKSMRKKEFHNLRLLILGEEVSRSELVGLSPCFLPLEMDFSLEVRSQVEDILPQVVVFDLNPQLLSDDLESLFAWLSQRGIRIVGVDSLLVFCNSIDLTWIPSFFVHPGKLSHCMGNTKYGWDSYLIQKRLPSKTWSPGSRVLVLTGGSDSTGQGEALPQKLDAVLPLDTEIHWVRGPFAKPPTLPSMPRLGWVVHEAPDGLDELIVESNYALAIYGVSFFELLQYGIPTVVFSPYGGKDDLELNALREEQVSAVSIDTESAVLDLVRLMGDIETARRYSNMAMERLSANGSDCMAEHLASLIEN